MARSILALTSGIHPLRIPLSLTKNEKWKPYPILNGITGGMVELSSHASVLAPGHSPHPPHTHKEEELLLLLCGEVDLILPGRPYPNKNERVPLKPGQFVYYPANFAHTLQTTGNAPACYLMFKWCASSKQSHSPLPFGRFDMLGKHNGTEVKSGFHHPLLFEGPTACLQKLHCHISTLAPGAGYNPHSDNYDVAIIVLEGDVETIGLNASPYDLIFYAEGEPHGMRNKGHKTAKYVVFEFHNREVTAIRKTFKLIAHLLARMTSLRSWRKRLKRLLNIG